MGYGKIDQKIIDKVLDVTIHHFLPDGELPGTTKWIDNLHSVTYMGGREYKIFNKYTDAFKLITY